MKAAYIEATGSPDVIRYGDLPTPTPRQGEVLVRVGAVDVNPIDLYIRAGTVAMPLPSRSSSAATWPGRSRRSAPDRAALQAGRPRLGLQPGIARPAGHVRGVRRRWRGLALSDPRRRRRRAGGGGGAWSGITAHLGLFRDGKLQAGETVFVNGGTGGIGAMVVQMAKAVGADVVTTVGPAREGRAVYEPGAPTACSITRPTTCRRRHSRLHRGKGHQRLVRDAARAGFRADGRPDGAARPDRRDRGAAGAADLPGRPVLRQGAVAVRLRHVQRHARRAAPLRRRDQPLAGGGQAAVRRSAGRSRWPRRRPPTASWRKTRCKKRERCVGKVVLTPQ